MSLVSIILPTYNRAGFLPGAITAIRSQVFSDWELIVVDDGSTDATAQILPELVAGMEQPYLYIYQANQGAYSARNRGIEKSQGDLIAFYDSDDLWLPHHLDKCVNALKANPDVGWVYGASRLVEYETDHVVQESSFYSGGTSIPCLRLPCEQRGTLRVLRPEGLATAVLNGADLYCGLQNSVIRHSLFSVFPFNCSFYNEAEDQVTPLRAIKFGMRIAYFDDVHVLYRLHGSNSSLSSTETSYEKRIKVTQGLISGFESFLSETPLSRDERGALRRKLARHYFWDLGYVGHWMNGRKSEAIKAMRHGLRLDPLKLSYWKTWCLCLLRCRF